MARFEELDDLSIDELLKLEESIVEDTEHLLRVLDDPNASTEQKSEIRNSDLKFNREQLEYIKNLVSSKRSERSL